MLIIVSPLPLADEGSHFGAVEQGIENVDSTSAPLCSKDTFSKHDSSLPLHTALSTPQPHPPTPTTTISFATITTPPVVTTSAWVASVRP